ncbi:MAG: glucose-6-phosphate isomerase family protein [Bacteroidota bacterium]
MKFNPGFDITPLTKPLGFKYGENCFGPEVENRTIDSIRKSLMNPNCDGPETVYSIAMDVGKKEHLPILKDKMLLYGTVTYAAGKLGKEPIRSQGHIHRKSSHSGWSPPEIYEIWTGKAIIYMQEYADDNPGKCYAVYAEAGEVVIVPPNWAHATISADSKQPLTFGAWCDREYGFEYDKVRAHKGLAWFPLIKENGEITWHANPNYDKSELIKKRPEDYSEFGIVKGEAVYETFEKNHETFQYVSKPYLKEREWEEFIP